MEKVYTYRMRDWFSGSLRSPLLHFFTLILDPILHLQRKLKYQAIVTERKGIKRKSQVRRDLKVIIMKVTIIFRAVEKKSYNEIRKELINQKIYLLKGK